MSLWFKLITIGVLFRIAFCFYSAGHGHSSPIVRVYRLVQLHYNQPLTASDIANRFNYNPAYLTSLFKKYTGYSLTHYINHARISAAKNLLTNQDQTIEAIAKQCGFTDTKYFTVYLKKKNTLPPANTEMPFIIKNLFFKLQ